MNGLTRDRRSSFGDGVKPSSGIRFLIGKASAFQFRNRV
jgi:hypothetical protein